MTTKIALGWLVGVLGLIFSMAMGLNALIRNRRERFVELILSGTKPADALVELGERSAAVQILDLISSAPFTMLDWIGSVTIRAITAVVRRRMHAPTADLTRDEA